MESPILFTSIDILWITQNQGILLNKKIMSTFV